MVNVFDDKLHYFQLRLVMVLIINSVLLVMDTNLDPMTLLIGTYVITTPYFNRREIRLAD